MVLACTIHDAHQDAVLEGLSPALAQRLTLALDKISTLDASQKQSVLRRVVNGLRPPLDVAFVDQMPPRAKLLLASQTTPELGNRWVENAPRQRVGYQPQATLIETLRRLATAPTKHADEQKVAKEAGWLA